MPQWSLLCTHKLTDWLYFSEDKVMFMCPLFAEWQKISVPSKHLTKWPLLAWVQCWKKALLSHLHVSFHQTNLNIRGSSDLLNKPQMHSLSKFGMLAPPGKVHHCSKISQSVHNDSCWSPNALKKTLCRAINLNDLAFLDCPIIWCFWGLLAHFNFATQVLFKWFLYSTGLVAMNKWRALLFTQGVHSTVDGWQHSQLK